MNKREQRRTLKRFAKDKIKKHYLFYVIICLVAAITGIAYTSSIGLFKSMVSYDELPQQQQTEYDTVSGVQASDVLEQILNDIQKDEEKQKSTGHLGIIELGKADGVFANFINIRAQGSPVFSLISAVQSIIRTKSAATVGIAICSLLMLLIWIFFINTYSVVMSRFFLEGRIYEKLSVDGFLWLIRQKGFFNAVLTLLLQYIFQFLWNLTIIGGLIKSYSYAMVPYIVAENPEIKPLEAITLSRKMMNGHKWELFVADWSFLLWDLLDIFTFGLTSLFYLAPYKAGLYAEYYVQWRNQAKEQNIKNTDELNDTYLYQFADKKILSEVYADVERYRKTVKKGSPMKQGVAKFFADIFGVVLFYDKTEQEYSDYMEAKVKLKWSDYVCMQKMYPSRLSPNSSKEEKRLMIDSLHYIRHYSVTSLIAIFFLLCFVGWLWEVGMHLVSDGVFVNRGVMHGPWLPIYGTGSIMIMLLLNKFRTKPVVEFFSAVVLCGIVEYFTSLYMELSLGKKWWDYSGYFLNIDGRICAEGLLVFGIGGVAVVYLIAPFLDNMLKKLNVKAVATVCILLVTVFIGDSVYSRKHPNAGKGITDYPAVSSQTDINT